MSISHSLEIYKYFRHYSQNSKNNFLTPSKTLILSFPKSIHFGNTYNQIHIHTKNLLLTSIWNTSVALNLPFLVHFISLTLLFIYPFLKILLKIHFTKPIIFCYICHKDNHPSTQQPKHSSTLNFVNLSTYVSHKKSANLLTSSHIF